jgi:hypothetical protein
MFGICRDALGCDYYSESLMHLIFPGWISLAHGPERAFSLGGGLNPRPNAEFLVSLYNRNNP